MFRLTICAACALPAIAALCLAAAQAPLNVWIAALAAAPVMVLVMALALLPILAMALEGAYLGSQRHALTKREDQAPSDPLRYRNAPGAER